MINRRSARANDCRGTCHLTTNQGYRRLLRFGNPVDLCSRISACSGCRLSMARKIQEKRTLETKAPDNVLKAIADAGDGEQWLSLSPSKVRETASVRTTVDRRLRTLRFAKGSDTETPSRVRAQRGGRHRHHAAGRVRTPAVAFGARAVDPSAVLDAAHLDHEPLFDSGPTAAKAAEESDRWPV